MMDKHTVDDATKAYMATWAATDAALAEEFAKALEAERVAWDALEKARSDAAKLMGSATSERKAAAARRNGKLGGRPRKHSPTDDTT